MRAPHARTHTRPENVHHDRNSQGDYLATDLIGSLQPTSGRECLRLLFIEIPRPCVTRSREVIFARLAYTGSGRE